MSQNLFRAPAKPTVITLDTLPDLFAHHRAVFGGWTMETPTDPPARPDDIPEAEWSALGDPGQRALVREREARRKAESDLAAARAPRPTPPRTAPPVSAPATASASDQGDQPDLQKLIQDAVAAAVKPFQDREAEREATEAANRIRQATIEAAKDVLHDPTDAVANIDLTTVTDGSGQPDQAKIVDALKKLVETKPHLARPDRRIAQPGFGAGGDAAPLEKRVQDTLRRMQEGAGLRVTAQNGS